MYNLERNKDENVHRFAFSEIKRKLLEKGSEKEREGERQRGKREERER